MLNYCGTLLVHDGDRLAVAEVTERGVNDLYMPLPGRNQTGSRLLPLPGTVGVQRP